ncbi:secreted/surface protein with fasciclin-like repeats [Aequorivita sublithincola DSM 14238]|uniref:Secreted/surface protein with fasciclin-like repeats n=1 Tax=Aequorivita sublithincola (strain DSM 14238 / LMG 21431 / ACAM 643 / 9-3) TaxID=746697 RepID=I3YY67_AEQSU|nr:fasciclin domain-containing protein [Aequorivita sublithincola]AFL81935.1 secreted/surface protein with fasciclin-like repeats [Aequorivita sublithincola DSM 14238]
MRLKNTILLLFMACLGTTVSAQKYLSTGKAEVSKEWEGNNFTSTKTFTENIAEAPQFTVLAKILLNDPLRQKLESEEMVTIFAMTNASFSELPKKSRDSILGNTALVNSMVKYLAVPGRIDSNSLQQEVTKNGGRTSMKTLDGQTLGIRETNGNLQLVDSENRTATIIASDFYHKNGFFHIVSGLIFPASEE